MGTRMNVSEHIIDELKAEEGFSATAYPDSTGYSIGHGTYIDTPEEQPLLNQTITREQADALLRQHVQNLVQVIRQRIRVPLNQNQLDALVLFTYNAGPYPISGGTVDDLINAGAKEADIRAKWMAYNKSRDRDGVLRVKDFLTRRRKEELDLYFTPIGDLRPDQKKKP